MPNVPTTEQQLLTSYRKISIATWSHPRDPSTYSWLELPVEEAEAFLKTIKADVRPSLTHYVALIVANCLDTYPQLNHVLRGRNLYRRASTDVFITTLLKKKGSLDLSGFVLKDMTGKGLPELAAESKHLTEVLKDGTDKGMQQVQQVAMRVPGWLFGPLMRIQMFFQYTLNLSLEAMGIPDDRFGSVMISNFGPLGIENALVPLSPYCRCPVIMGIGAPKKKAVVVGDEVVVRKCVTISFTFDHRYADGAHGAVLLHRFEKMFLNPEQYRSVFLPGTTSDTAGTE